MVLGDEKRTAVFCNFLIVESAALFCTRVERNVNELKIYVNGLADRLFFSYTLN